MSARHGWPGKDRHHHGQPLGLADDEVRRRRAGRAGRRLRGQGGLRPSHPEAALRVRRDRQGARPPGDHRRRRRGGAPARHDGRHHASAGAGRSHRARDAVGPGQPAVDRADAGGRAGRHARHRQARRHQRGAAGGADPGAGGRRPRQAAWRRFGPSRRRRFPRHRRAMPEDTRRARPASRLDHRHPGQRPARTHAGDGRRAPRPQDARLLRRQRPGLRRGDAHHQGRLRRSGRALRVRGKRRRGHLRVRERGRRHRPPPRRPGAGAAERQGAGGGAGPPDREAVHMPGSAFRSPPSAPSTAQRSWLPRSPPSPGPPS